MKAPTMMHVIVMVEAIEMMTRKLAQSDVVLSEPEERLMTAAVEAVRETKENE